jgi:uncharacterized protein (DUF433 family)
MAMCEPIPKRTLSQGTYKKEGVKTRMSNEVDENAKAVWKDRIESNPNILFGKPVVKGTRLGVDLIVDLFSWGWSESDILENYPGLTRDDIRACLSYASDTLRRCFSIHDKTVQNSHSGTM